MQCIMDQHVLIFCILLQQKINVSTFFFFFFSFFFLVFVVIFSQFRNVAFRCWFGIVKTRIQSGTFPLWTLFLTRPNESKYEIQYFYFVFLFFLTIKTHVLGSLTFRVCMIKRISCKFRSVYLISTYAQAQSDSSISAGLSGLRSVQDFKWIAKWPSRLILNDRPTNTKRLHFIPKCFSFEIYVRARVMKSNSNLF